MSACKWNGNKLHLTGPLITDSNYPVVWWKIKKKKTCNNNFNKQSKVWPANKSHKDYYEDEEEEEERKEKEKEGEQE